MLVLLIKLKRFKNIKIFSVGDDAMKLALSGRQPLRWALSCPSTCIRVLPSSVSQT